MKIELDTEQLTKLRQCWEVNLGAISQEPSDEPEVRPDTGIGDAFSHPILGKSAQHNGSFDPKTNPSTQANESTQEKLHQLQKALMAEKQQELQARQTSTPSLKRS